MQTDFIKPSKQIKVRQVRAKDNWADTNYLVWNAYHLFRKETGIKDITYKQFCQIPRRIHAKLIERCLQGRYSARIPNLGVIRVIRYKPTKEQCIIPDWAATNKTGVFTTRQLRTTPEGRHAFVTSMYSEKNQEYNLYTLKISTSYRTKLGQQAKTGKVNYKLVED